MDEQDAKNEARRRAVQATADWAEAHVGDDVVVVSWLVIAEVMGTAGRRVTWVGGNGNDPDDEDRAGLMRWQLRGLLSEVEAGIVGGEAE